MKPMSLRCGWIATMIAALTMSSSVSGRQGRGEIPSAPEPVPCRVMEAKTAQSLGVRVVVFHQGESSDRDAVGTFVKEHDGADVQFQTPGGSWQVATMFRLKSCFGRGLLVLRADQAQLAEGDRFLLRLAPADK